MVGNSNGNTNFPNELSCKIFVKLLLKIHQLTLNCQKLNYQK